MVSKMGNKLDTWGKWKREAIRDYDRASSKYLRTKSPGEIYLSALKKSKLLSKLPWYERLGVKAAAWHGEVTRKNTAAGHLVAEAAAGLAPDSWEGVAFDLGTLAIGAVAGAVGKIAKLGKLGKLGRLGGPMRPTTFKALQDLHKAAGLPEIASRAAQVQKVRIDRMEKIIRSAKVVGKATHAVHAGHMAGKSVKHIATNIPYKEQIKTSLKPRTSFSQHPWSQIPVPPKQKAAKKVTLRHQRGPNYSFLNQVKVADWMLQSMHKPVKPKSRPYDPFMSTTDRLQGIEKSAESRLAEERRIRTLLNRFESSISKPQPFNAHEQMQKNYGAKIDAIAKRTPKFTSGSAYISPQDWMSLQKKLGICQSSISPMSRPITSGAGQYLRPNPLRSIAGALVNPNRTRPMMRSPMFR